MSAQMVSTQRKTIVVYLDQDEAQTNTEVLGLIAKLCRVLGVEEDEVYVRYLRSDAAMLSPVLYSPAGDRVRGLSAIKDYVDSARGRLTEVHA